MGIHDKKIKLSDGRSLGYAQYGDIHGRPLLYFHGLPGSRLDSSGPAPSAIAEKLGIRVVALDRPGFGLSDFQPERTLGDWPKDVVEAADALSLNTFAVLGLSGGGPYDAACARYISERLTAATVVGAARAGGAPWRVPFPTVRPPSSRRRDIYLCFSIVSRRSSVS